MHWATVEEAMAKASPSFPLTGKTFYEGCQVPANFFQAAWRIFCRVMLAKW